LQKYYKEKMLEVKYTYECCIFTS